MDERESITAIVLGSDVTALGTIRSLHRFGVSTLFSNRCDGFASWSRYKSGVSGLPSQTVEAKNLAAWLNALTLENAVLMPCSDPWVRSVAQLDALTCQRFRRWTPAPDIVEAFLDKDRFRAMLEELGLPHPRSFFLDRNKAGANVPDKIFESAFLKPLDSSAFFSAFGVKGFHARSKKECLQRAARAWDKDIDLLVQQYISGPPSNHYFIDGYRPMQCGEPHYLARRRLRMFPADLGNSTHMVSVPLEVVSTAILTLESIFRRTGFHGIFSAEFKLDQNDGLLKILEVNIRPWWYVDFADRCGLHACGYACLDAVGLKLPPNQPYAIGKYCSYARQDLEAYRTSKDRGFVTLLCMIKSWLRSSHPVFDWRDPLPAIAKLSQTVFDTAIRGCRCKRQDVRGKPVHASYHY